MKEFLDKVREGEDREAVRVVGEHSIKMGIKSHRMMGYAFRYANESGEISTWYSAANLISWLQLVILGIYLDPLILPVGLFEEKDIEEGVKDEFEYDGDVLEQAQKLVKRAKDGNCDGEYDTQVRYSSSSREWMRDKSTEPASRHRDVFSWTCLLSADIPLQLCWNY